MSKAGYPVWWDTTITVYNRYEDEQTNLVTWYRNVVTDCFWKYTGDKIKIGDTILETNTIICRVPKDEKFRTQDVWASIPNDQRGQYYTFSPNDIIVMGEVDDVVNEYESGHRSTDLLDKYKKLQGCMQVETVAINTHTGTNNPHYYVRGI